MTGASRVRRPTGVGGLGRPLPAEARALSVTRGGASAGGVGRALAAAAARALEVGAPMLPAPAVTTAPRVDPDLALGGALDRLAARHHDRDGSDGDTVARRRPTFAEHDGTPTRRRRPGPAASPGDRSGATPATAAVRARHTDHADRGPDGDLGPGAHDAGDRTPVGAVAGTVGDANDGAGSGSGDEPARSGTDAAVPSGPGHPTARDVRGRADRQDPSSTASDDLGAADASDRRRPPAADPRTVGGADVSDEAVAPAALSSSAGRRPGRSQLARLAALAGDDEAPAAGARGPSGGGDPTARAAPSAAMPGKATPASGTTPGFALAWDPPPAPTVDVDPVRVDVPTAGLAGEPGLEQVLLHDEVHGFANLLDALLALEAERHALIEELT